MSYEVLIGRGIPYQQTNHTVIRVSCFFCWFPFRDCWIFGEHIFHQRSFFWYVLRPFSDLIVCESIQACRNEQGFSVGRIETLFVKNQKKRGYVDNLLNFDYFKLK